MNATAEGPASSPGREPGPRRRPGRLRRWVVRPLAWAVALLVLLLLSLRLALDSDLLRERVRRWLVAFAEERTGRQVEIESLDFGWLPLSAELRGLRIGGVEPADPPFLTVARLDVDADVVGLLRPVFTLRRVAIEEPVVNLAWDAEGTPSYPRFARTAAAPGVRSRSWNVRIGLLSLEGGALELEQSRLPLELSARDVEAHLLGIEGGVQGSVSGGEIEVQLPRARPYLGELEARVRVRPSGLEVLAARLRGPDLSGEVRGSVAWGAADAVELLVRAESHTRLFQRLGYVDEQVQGPIRFDGAFSWRPQVWGLRGRVGSPRLRLFERHVGPLAGDVAIDRHRLHLEVERAAYAGGSLRGSVSVNLAADPRLAELNLEGEGMDLAAFLADQGLSLGEVTGMVAGLVSYRFRLGEPLTGDGGGTLHLSAPALGGGLPFDEGTVPLVIEDGVLRTEGAVVFSPDQRLNVDGLVRLPDGEGSFEFELTSERIEEVFAALPLPEGEGPPLWVPVAGKGTAEGRLLLTREGGPRGLIQLQLWQVEAPGLAADRVRGGLAIDRTALRDLRLELTRPEGVLSVEGFVPFGETSPGDGPAGARIALEAQAWPLEQAKPWLPFELPFEGDFSGSVELAAAEAGWSGRVDGRAAPARAGELEVAELAAQIEFDPQAVRLLAGRLRDEAGEVAVAGTLALPGGELDFDLSSPGLELSRAPLAGILPAGMGGRLEVSGRLEGTLEAPRGTLSLTGIGVHHGEHLLGQTSARARWEDSRLEMEGELGGLLSLSGGGRLDREGLDLTLGVESDRLHDLAALVVPSDLPLDELEGGFEGTLGLTGAFSKEGSFQARLEVGRLAADFREHRLRNLDPVVVRLVPEALVIDSLFLGEEDGSSEVFVAGRVALDGTTRLGLQLQASVEAAWLELFFPEAHLEGTIDLLATVGGTADLPRLNGQGELREGRLVYGDFYESLQDVKGIVLFYPQQVVVDHLIGRAGGGQVRIGGTVGLADTGEGGATYQLQIAGRGLTLLYPEGWRLRGDADLVLASGGNGRELGGTVRLDRLDYVVDLETGLLQQFRHQRVEVVETNELLAATQLNVLVRGEDALRVRNNVARLEGSLDLALRGSLARPVLFGDVVVEPGGTLAYGGNDYEVERGELSFTNPFRLEPVIDLVAVTEVGEYDIRLNLSGPVERLNASFSSEPPLPHLEILSLLAGGGVPEEELAVGDEETETSIGAAGLLYGQAASLVAQRANTLFGLDELRIDPLTGSSGDVSAARVSVGKRLSRDLFVTYAYDPSSTGQQIFQVEWQITGEFTLVLTQNGDGTYAADVRQEKRF